MNLREAASGPPFDAVVIGGGINGAAVAREASLRGLRIALFEASDFGSGTTWRSTRLIHGGLRYLEHREFGLVFESLRERGRLLRERPHLVKPQPFVIPVTRGRGRPAWQVRSGLTVYDLFALHGGLPRHSRLSRHEVQELLPASDPENGGFRFYDAVAVAPERLALELALEARDAGAVVLNHARVTAIETRHGLVRGVKVEHDGEATSIATRTVVNAAGPWVDAVNRAAGVEGPRIIGATRGSHLAIELPEPAAHTAVLSTAVSDNRVFFALPHSGVLLVGTTDIRSDEDPGCLRPTEAEVRYLLSEAQSLFPRAGITADHVRFAFAGLRPLVASSGGPEASIPRRHALVDHGRQGGPEGLLSLAGGKLSTYRPLAREVLARLGRRWERHHAPPPPAPLPDAAGRHDGVAHHLERYGAHAPGLLAHPGTVLCPHAGAVSSEVEHAVRNEQAVTLSDVLMRRTGIAWHSCRGLCCHREVARLMAPLLGWDERATESQVKTFQDDLDHNLPQWGQIVRTREESDP